MWAIVALWLLGGVSQSQVITGFESEELCVNAVNEIRKIRVVQGDQQQYSAVCIKIKETR